MTSRQRGGAPVGHLADLDAVGAGAVMYLRMWADGSVARARVCDDFRRAHGIGMVPSARIADGGDVVDIDPETQPVAQAARLPGLVTGIAASSAGTSSSS